jgi:hypothetical protein
VLVLFQVLETNAKALNPVTFVDSVLCLSIVQVIFASLLIDYYPRSKTKVVLLELVSVHAWFFGKGRLPEHSRTILTLREVFLREFGKNSVTARGKAELLSCLPEPDPRAPPLSSQTFRALDKNTEPRVPLRGPPRETSLKKKKGGGGV